MRKTNLAGATLATIALLAIPLTSALAHDDEKRAPVTGQKGATSDVTRTVDIKMIDNLFEPAALSVTAGETVRFVVSNAGEFVHEFNIGNHEMHMAHQKEMMMMVEMGALEVDRINHEMMRHNAGPAMKHDDPNSILLEPGMTGEVVWTFPSSGELQMACNVPGHYEAGMVGEITIQSVPSS